MSILTEISTTSLVLLAILAFATFIQLIYYWLVFVRLAFYKRSVANVSGIVSQPGVSIVMSARDEYHHLVKNLPALLAQDYPDFEVVVVNHTSSDETTSLLKELAPFHPNLKVVNIEQELNFFKGKKFPLSIGIKSAKNDLLLLTDADCKPASNQWIKHMVQHYDTKTEVVLGYGPYDRQKGLLNLLIRYDTFIVAMQYLSYALAGIPYMGVGRNLSYRKSLFIKNKGFTSHYRISSGDDDLFINKVAHRRNTTIEIHPESFMYSEPKTTLRGYFRQKRRHLTTGKYYKAKFKWLLGLFSFTQMLFWLMFILLLSLNIQPILVLSLFLLKLTTNLIIQKKVASRLGEPHLLLFSLAIEPVYVILIPAITLLSSINQPKAWK
ncbi:MAG: glycosyltransferase [Bacteroidales bacterium]|jgi:cellulose synthase/poly-beta-1,6-N-acetylglucosamine synthase-like glycosyltransferase